MAKSLTEQVRELTTDLRVLESTNESLRAQLVDLKNADQKQQAETTELRKENAELRRELAELKQETTNAITAIKQQLQDHLAQYQEWDKRRWGLIVMVFGAVLSSLLGLFVTLVRK